MHARDSDETHGFFTIFHVQSPTSLAAGCNLGAIPFDWPSKIIRIRTTAAQFTRSWIFFLPLWLIFKLPCLIIYWVKQITDWFSSIFIFGERWFGGSSLHCGDRGALEADTNALRIYRQTKCEGSLSLHI